MSKEKEYFDDGQVKELLNAARMLYAQQYRWATSDPKTLRLFLLKECSRVGIGREQVPPLSQISRVLESYRDTYIEDIKFSLSPMFEAVLQATAHHAIKGSHKHADLFLNIFNTKSSESNGANNGLAPITFSAHFKTDAYEEVEDTDESEEERITGSTGEEGGS